METLLRVKTGFDLKGFKPLPGYAVGIPQVKAAPVKDGIVIPDSVFDRSVPADVAEIVAEHAIIHPRGQMSIRGTIGRTVKVNAYSVRQLNWKGMTLYVIRLTIRDILAVYYDGEWIPLASEGAWIDTAPGEPGIERCKFCKKGGAGIILDGNGVCPICRRRADGKPAGNYKYQSTDGTTHTFDAPLANTAELRETLGTEEDKTPSGKFISYPGDGG